MKINSTLLYISLLGTICLHFSAAAQQKTVKPDRNLFSAGYAAGFIGGLYDAFYPYSNLKQHGDFGLGAPAQLDGELIMLNGKIYQTRYTGKTTPVAITGKVPYAVVCFFYADKVFKPNRPMNKDGLYQYLDSVLNNRNGIYAVHIKGSFKYVKTRAFPPVKQKPYLPLAAMLDKQHFFEYHNLSGDLAGYKLPAFMEGAHITGNHFHFLSDKKDAGGHLIELLTDNITIEVETLSSYTMELPQNAGFKNFDFKKDRKEEIKSVENGKKR
ncbi:alpha-acetolactate decarboxylase [soil metagenome]|jgi:acetolactate decarboxylase